jgi:RNA polymerase sigma-70 factor (ECF subfamily)
MFRVGRLVCCPLLWKLLFMTENNKIDNSAWKAYRKALYRFILARVNDPEISEDIVQNVLIKVYEELHSLKNKDKILPWMYQITRNAIADHYRKYKPVQTIEQIVLKEEADSEDYPERELAQCLIPWIHQLPPIYRHAIELSELDGLTQNDVAKKQGLSVSGAKSRVQRGRTLLKKRLLACCRLELDRQGNIFNYECKNC